MTAVELAKLHAIFKHELPTTGPLAALADALQLLGWSWTEAGTLTDDDGERLQLVEGSPAMLRKFVLTAWRRRLCKGLSTLHPQFKDWEPRVLLQQWHSKSASALTRQEKVTMLRYISGVVLTPAKLAEWGYCIPTECPLCGMQDTAEHRVQDCTDAQVAELRKEVCDEFGPNFLKVHRGILAGPPLPPFIGHSDTCTIKVGEYVAGEAFFLPEYGPVYVDGSVVHPTLPLARAAFAALQFKDGVVVRAAIGTVSPRFPQTADVAEHFVIRMVTNLGADGCAVCVVSDCASAVRSFTVGQQAADHHSSPHAGIWRGIDRKRLAEVVKVKAHLTKAAAEATGHGEHWHGNQLVDLLAKEAARGYSTTEAQVKEYERSVKLEAALLRTAAKLLVAWPVQAPDLKHLTRAAKQPRKKVLGGKRHNFVWLQHLRVWRCSECGITKRRPKCSFDRAPCVGRKWIENNFHASHKLAVASVLDHPSQLFACIRCGLYAESSARGLMRPCACTGAGGSTGGKSAGTAYRLKRFFSGKHPKLKNVRLGKPARFIPGPPQADDTAAENAQVSCHVPDPRGLSAPHGGTVPVDADAERDPLQAGAKDRETTEDAACHGLTADGVAGGSVVQGPSQGPAAASACIHGVSCSALSAPEPKRRRLRGKQPDIAGAFSGNSTGTVLEPECVMQDSAAKRRKMLSTDEAGTASSQRPCSAIASGPNMLQVCMPVSATTGVVAAAAFGNADDRCHGCCPHEGQVADVAVSAGTKRQLCAVGGVTALLLPNGFQPQGNANEVVGDFSEPACHEVAAFVLPPEDEMHDDGRHGFDEADEDVFDYGGDLGLAAYHN